MAGSSCNPACNGEPGGAARYHDSLPNWAYLFHLLPCGVYFCVCTCLLEQQNVQFRESNQSGQGRTIALSAAVPKARTGKARSTCLRHWIHVACPSCPVAPLFPLRGVSPFKTNKKVPMAAPRTHWFLDSSLELRYGKTVFFLGGSF